MISLDRISLTLSAHGTASPEVAWERYADLDAWQTWSPQIQAVEADGRRIRDGLTGRVVGPLGVRVAFTVLAVHEVPGFPEVPGFQEVPERDWTWRISLPLRQRITMLHTVRPEGAGSATELRMTGPAPLLLGYAPLAQLALRKLVRA